MINGENNALLILKLVSQNIGTDVVPIQQNWSAT